MQITTSPMENSGAAEHLVSYWAGVGGPQIGSHTEVVGTLACSHIAAESEGTWTSPIKITLL